MSKPVTIQLFLIFIAICGLLWSIGVLYYSIRWKDRFSGFVGFLCLIFSLLLLFNTL